MAAGNLKHPQVKFGYDGQDMIKDIRRHPFMVDPAYVLVKGRFWARLASVAAAAQSHRPD